MFDTNAQFHRELLKMEHRGWTEKDLRRYLEWEGGNKPGLLDYAKKLWRVVRNGRRVSPGNTPHRRNPRADW